MILERLQILVIPVMLSGAGALAPRDSSTKGTSVFVSGDLLELAVDMYELRTRSLAVILLNRQKFEYVIWMSDGHRTVDLGGSTNRFANVYTGDLHLKNDKGDWTIEEERDCLVVVNNITKKKFRMVLEPYDE